MAKVKGRTKQRIGHANPGTFVRAALEPGAEIPRGWIHPGGRFYETSKHWEMISKQLKLGAKDPEQGERAAHVAYSLGWISIGHGGAINAIGHKRVFDQPDHPAMRTLRKVVAGIPHFSLRVEKQLGALDPVTGKHEDFDVREYDLMFFLRRGRLRET